MIIKINDVSLDGDLEVLNEENKEFNFSFSVYGENDYYLYSSLLASRDLVVNIPEYGMEFKVLISKYSKSYKDTLDENTHIRFSFKLEERSEDAEWSPFTGLFQTAIGNWSRTRALAKILKGKGLLEDEEYENLIAEIHESDFEEMKKFILKGQ